MNDNYRPRGKGAQILGAAMAHIQSVPYKVTLRWVFYRLLQDGWYHGKEDYKVSFIPLQSKARKCFYREWRPDTLADDTRQVIVQGNGFDSVSQWVQAIAQVEYTEVVWHSQKHYTEVWFEAEAMSAQFRHYVRDIPLFAFRGECSIAAKWAAAKRLEKAYELYRLSITVLYFGDDDPKGREIPENAVEDIQAWCKYPVRFLRGGLNPGDGARLGIPESIDKPGAYQWEALDDDQAGRLITTAVSDFFDVNAASGLKDKSWLITSDVQAKLVELLKGY